MVHSQVRRGRPGRRLQSLGNPRIDVYMALDVCCDKSVCVPQTTLVLGFYNSTVSIIKP